MEQLEALLLQLRGGRADGLGVGDSNSTDICGTGRPAGHSGVPKQASAACESGHTAKCLTPSISSLWKSVAGLGDLGARRQSPTQRFLG